MSKFIAFEGGEGVGKSTQLKFLKEYLEKTGQKAVFTREPGGTPLAEKIRELILHEDMSAECEAQLFAAARIDHIDNFIKPNLADGNIVICDRYIDSSIAYQGYARGLGEETVLHINSYAVENCMPDAVVFFDMNPVHSWRRQNGMVIEGDRLEAEADEFHEKVYFAFKKLAEENSRFVIIKPDKEKTITAQRVVDALKERGIID